MVAEVADGEQELTFDGENEDGEYRDLGVLNSGADEWAFYGWFRYVVPEQMHSVPVTVLRAVMNNPAEGELNDA